MKRNAVKESVSAEPIYQFDADDFAETAVLTHDASAEYYERRWHDKIKLERGDWWIAIGLYLTLCSVAFVVL